MKAKAIRDALDQLGWNTSNKDIIAYLRRSGTIVTSQQISNERAKHQGVHISFAPGQLIELGEFLKDKKIVDFLAYLDKISKEK